MANDAIAINEFKVRLIDVFMYVPPIVWKGDCIGHIGKNDTFFFVLEGECFLVIDDEYSIIRPGQLAFLPKGKKRAYTHASEHFCMYEMAFSANGDGQNLMEILGLTQSNFVVDVPEKEKMCSLFENSFRKELFKEPIYDVSWCANVLNIIKCYAESHKKSNEENADLFEPVLSYMKNNLKKNIKTSDLSSLVYMQPTYFIRRFKDTFGLPPSAYLTRLKLYNSMKLLISTNESIEHISEMVGISDTSYFARMFKKHCGSTPTEYRRAFRKGQQ